jgi:hypothetical protein
MVVSGGIFRVCFAQFLCGYPVLIKKLNIEKQLNLQEPRDHDKVKYSKIKMGMGL